MIVVGSSYESGSLLLNFFGIVFKSLQHRVENRFIRNNEADIVWNFDGFLKTYKFFII